MSTKLPRPTLKPCCPDTVFEGTLFAARQGSCEGSSCWETFKATHDIDGRLSLSPENGTSDDFALDIDWREPFVVAPYTSLPASFGQESGSNSRFYPFTLTYAPLTSKPDPSNLAPQLRRTVLLAASTEADRSRWMGCLTQKASVRHFRQAAQTSNDKLMHIGAPIVNRASCGTGYSWKDNIRISPLGDQLRLSSGADAQMSKYGGSQASRIGNANSGRKSAPVLPSGRGNLWAVSTPHRCVQDLFDNYAADPLGVSRARGMALKNLSHASGAWSRKRVRFLEKYIERQAQIEAKLEGRLDDNLNEKRLGDVPKGKRGSGRRSHADSLTKSLEQDNEERVETVDRSVSAMSDTVPPARCTPNATLEDDGNFSVEKWSGGVIFGPSSAQHFYLSIRLIDPPAENPVFVGVVVENTDLMRVNLFDGNRCGVFLCVGGQCGGNQVAPLGATGGIPSLYEFGRRSVTQLPRLRKGDTVDLEYSATSPTNALPNAVSSAASNAVANGGNVWFHVTTESPQTGQKITRSSDPVKIPPGIWKPCLLLCVPGSKAFVLSVS